MTDTAKPGVTTAAPPLDLPQTLELLLEANIGLRAELTAANAVITEAVSANLASSNILDAANGMINALKKSPLEAPLLRAHNATVAADGWVLVAAGD